MAVKRFKFQSFTQRVASIKIDVVHRIGEAREVPDEEQDTFFRESLAKWSELNCTQDFVDFQKEVQRFVQDLKQLFFYKDEVFEILCRYLSNVKSTCFDALLDLMAQFTRDLQYEVYPYFKRILDTLTMLLHIHDADIIENTFVCLAFIFKYLWRYMVNEPNKIYGYYKQLLLSSQKLHIRQFAAESIAFLIRKIRDKDGILDALFSSVVSDPCLIDGVGILLFETIKGVNQMFHSCAGEIVSLALRKLTTGQLKAFECLEVTFKAACKHASRQTSHVLLDCLFAEIGSFLSSIANMTAPCNSSKVFDIIRLIMILVEWKSGVLVENYAGKIQKMLDELLSQKYDVNCDSVLLELFAQLMQIKTLDSPSTVFHPTIDLIFKADFKESQISDFMLKCKTSHLYHQVLLPCFLKQIETSLLEEMDYQSERSVLLIKCLCQQVALSSCYFTGIFQSKCDDFHLFYFSQAAKNNRLDGCNSVADVVLKNIDQFSEKVILPESDSLNTLDAVWCCVVLLPYLRPVDVDKALNSLLKLTQLCISSGGEAENKLVDMLLFLASQAIRSFYLIKSSSKNTTVNFSFESLLSLLQYRPSNVHVLQGFERYSKLCDQRDAKSSVGEFQRVCSIVKFNLSSNLPIVRQLSLLILFNLTNRMEISKDENFKLMIIQKCLNAEEIVLSFENYMKRLLHLRKLVFCSIANEEDQSFANEVVIRFLIGNLRVNLRPMWLPIMEVMKTHEQNGKQFWLVFRELLQNAFSSNDSKPELEMDYGDYTFAQYISNASEVDSLSRPDDNSFRLLMCEAMGKFPQLVESKSRDVLPIFFIFLSTEYGRFDEFFAATQDLTTRDQRANDQVEEVISADDQLDDFETKKNGTRRSPPTNKLKILKAFLRLFGQFKNPKAVYQEGKLYSTYLEMLMHRDSEIQQLVWSCLKTYKFDYLKPYEEHFDKLFQNSTFRDALTLFSASEEDQVIRLDHRKSFINVLCRLLCGKLQRRSGLGVGGKSNVSARRNIIINFISCCPDEEVSIFINLITGPFKLLCHDYILVDEVDTSNVIPLRKQIGFLNMLHTVLKKLNNLIGQHIDQLMTTLLNILKLCQACLERRDMIANTFVGKLKSIRQLCISRITDFFQFFQDFDFEPYVEMIFDTAVTPQISRLSSESQQHPSPLLKLLHHWSTSKRYFYLLNRDVKVAAEQTVRSTAVDDRNVCPSPGPREAFLSSTKLKTDNSGTKNSLFYIFSILSAGSKSDAVVKLVLNIAENILQMDEIRDSRHNGTADTLPLSGKEMMLPYVNVLLDHFCDAIKHKKSLKTGLSKTVVLRAELGVLALISGFAKQPQQCQAIVSLLFPTLKIGANEKDQCNTLITIKNIVTYCESTKAISAEMVNLFISIKGRNARGHLCDLFKTLSDKKGTSSKVSDLISDINAWDPKYVDEPNFERRLKGFSSFTAMLKAKELSNKDIRPLLANCLFYSVESQDMSLRDASISCIFHVIDFVTDSNHHGFDDVIQELVVPILKTALRSKNEIIRTEFIGILAKIVKDFDKTPISDMKVLSSTDPEVDFFENIKHIQTHRRIRAVRQLQQLVKEKKFKQNSLFSFLLPLVSHFVFDATSSKDHNLVTAAIDATGAIMSCLPWQKYSHFLRSYLRLLPKEKSRKKTIIRVVVAVLDAFHFDLSMITDADIEREKSFDLKKPAEARLEQGSSIDVDNESGKNNEADIEEEVNESLAEAELGDIDNNDKEAGRLKAMKIHHVICSAILPQLQKSMVKKSFVEDYHRKSHNKEVDDDAVLRVPIALAIVKLLQKLPKTTLHEQLPGILLRVCQTLKSRARDVRDAARETLVNIASSLGPEYFPFVLKEMKSVLQRGYQLHVLAYSLKSLFDGLMDQLKPGDLDQCLSSIIQILIQDLFQNVAEEKEAQGITGKLHEAKSRKSFDSFEIISRLATPSSFGKIIDSVKEVLETNHTHEVSNKAQEILRRIGLGLQNNSSLLLDDLLVFAYHTLKNLQPFIKDKETKEVGLKKADEGRMAREDIYLVKKEPIRGKKLVESNRKANLHVLAEFALQLFHSFLKNQRLLPSKAEHKEMLDPYVKVIIDCIKSKYNRVIILAVKSITHLLRFPLPSLASNTNDLATVLFKLLKNYARIGAGTGDNYELVLSAFKAMTVIVRDAKKYKITNEQLKILLTFVEEDIFDYTRQATAFPMLKAILSRKLDTQEISDIMKKIAELSVTSGSESVQLQCRQLMLQYLLDFPLGKKIEVHFHFYIAHLGYEHESGRKSSLELLALIFKNFPEKHLGKYSEFFYFPLVMRLVNDDSPICRKLTNAVLKMLLQKLELEKRTGLYDITLSWLQQDKVSLKRLAIQAIGTLAEVEKATFEKRVLSFMPELQKVIQPDLYNDYENDDELEELRSKDQLLFNALSSLMKIIQCCNILRKPAYQDHFNEMWGSIENHLQHAHTWVRLAACQLFTQLFAVWQPPDLVKSWKANKDKSYLTDNLPSKIKRLCLDFCEQLKSDLVTEELAEQIAKNLIYLMKIINLLEDDQPGNEGMEDPNEQLNKKNGEAVEKPPTLHWFLTKLSYLASYEASKEQKMCIKRICVFRCLAAVSLDLGKERISPFMTEILRPLHRELNSSASDSELYKLTQEVVELIKGLVGKETFAEMYAKLQRKVSEKKETRKRKVAEEAVVNPERFAKKKQRKNLAKRDQRKRKLAEKKPSLLKRSKRAKTDAIGKDAFI